MLEGGPALPSEALTPPLDEANIDSAVCFARKLSPVGQPDLVQVTWKPEEAAAPAAGLLIGRPGWVQAAEAPRRGPPWSCVPREFALEFLPASHLSRAPFHTLQTEVGEAAMSTQVSF